MRERVHGSEILSRLIEKFILFRATLTNGTVTNQSAEPVHRSIYKWLAPAALSPFKSDRQREKE